LVEPGFCCLLQLRDGATFIKSLSDPWKYACPSPLKSATVSNDKQVLAPHHSMGRKIDQLPFVIVLCSLFGLVFGATASQAEMNQCLASKNPSNQCLTQNPTLKRLEGMGMGLFAGAGAAIGATWHFKKKG
jgi:hypothetical protein